MTHAHRTAPHRAAARNRRLAAACALLLTGFLVQLALAGNAAAASGFSVSPLRYDVSIDPGQTVTKKITVVNTTSNKLTFTVSREDVGGNSSDPNANPVLLGGEVESPISGVDWLDPNTNSFSLQEGDERVINVNVTAPSGATGGHYAAITITSSAQRISDTLTAQSRVAVLFFMNAGGTPPPEIVIEDVVTTTDGETIIDYVNKGDTAAKPKALIEYVDPVTGEVVQVGTGECGTALPGAVARCIVEKLDQKGRSLLPSNGQVTLINEGRKTRADLPREWSGSWSSGLLPLTGIALMAIYFLRLRRREDDDEEDEGALPV